MKCKLLGLLTDPEYLGCRHLKFVASDPEGYRIREELFQSVINAFYMTMWNKTDEVQKKLTYVMHTGPKTESALVNVMVPQECAAMGLAPLVLPHSAPPSCPSS